MERRALSVVGPTPAARAVPPSHRPTRSIPPFRHSTTVRFVPSPTQPLYPIPACREPLRALRSPLRSFVRSSDSLRPLLSFFVLPSFRVVDAVFIVYFFACACVRAAPAPSASAASVPRLDPDPDPSVYRLSAPHRPSSPVAAAYYHFRFHFVSLFLVVTVAVSSLCSAMNLLVPLTTRRSLFCCPSPALETRSGAGLVVGRTPYSYGGV